MDRIRITKLLAQRSLCSRREAEWFISQGWVSVDGEIVRTPFTRVMPNAEIVLAAEALQARSRKITVLLNKPIGYVSSPSEKGYPLASSLIVPENKWHISKDSPIVGFKSFQGLSPAGRLDIDSQGLLILTQDGVLAKQIIGDQSMVEKEYLVRFTGTLTREKLELLNHGLSIDGHPLKPACVTPIHDHVLRFILWEGRKRQIRRMCELVGLKVVQLKRVRIGQLRLGGLPLGKWRFLGPNEHI